MATLLPEGKQSFTDDAGNPLVGGKLYTYDAGTNTPRPTFVDATGTIPNTNPVILNARGEATVFWDGSYKAVLKDANDVTIWTVDNIRDINRMVVDALEATGAIDDATAIAVAAAESAAESAAQAAAALGVGRLVAVQTFTASGTYTPSPGTSFIIVELQGAGGAGGGCDAAPVGQNAVSSGGASGAYCKLLLTTGFGPTSTVTIGAAGVANSAADGGAGGDTYFNTGATTRRAFGGIGGTMGAASATFPRITGVPSYSASFNIMGTYQAIIFITGTSGGSGISLSSIIAGPGAGAGSPLSNAAPQQYLTSGGVGSSSGYGAGGSGACTGPSNAARDGEAGRPGIVIIHEYSAA